MNLITAIEGYAETSCTRVYISIKIVFFIFFDQIQQNRDIAKWYVVAHISSVEYMIHCENVLEARAWVSKLLYDPT